MEVSCVIRLEICISNIYIILYGLPPFSKEYCSALVYVIFLVRHNPSLIYFSWLWLCRWVYLTYMTQQVFTRGVSEARLCDGNQSEISFLCVLNLKGHSIVFSLLFWSLSSTTWTMLFLLPLCHFCLRSSFINFFGFITWHGRLFSGPLVIFI